MHVLFFEIPSFEELQDPNRSPGREEVGRRTPREYGGFLLSFFYRDRFHKSVNIETLPDKKTGVGSLRSPREYDGRLPPDAGYYLDLVIPRKEEPRKKNGSPGKIIAWKNVTNRVINLLVKLARILVNH